MPSYISAVKWENTSSHPLLAVAVSEGNIWIVDIMGTLPAFSFRDTNVAGDVSDITWHPTTRQLAVALQLGVSAVLNPVDIWDIDTQRMTVLFRDYEIETSVAWHPRDPDVIAVGFIDGRAELWQLSNKTMLYRVKPTIPDDIVHTLAWSPDGTQLAIGYDFSLRVLSYPTFQDTLSYTVSEVIDEIAWHRDNHRLAILVSQGIEVIDASNGSQLYSETIPGFMRGVAWSPDGKRLIYGGDRTGFRGEFRIFDAPPLSAIATPRHSP